MKIRRLDLIAYGPFQNQSLVFESNGIQLIFGPNEAGKSTALRALQAVLYGMTDKRDAFVHPWDMMRVGMTIETAEGTIKVERRKGKGARSLVHADSEKSVSPEEWSGILPVADQKLFLQMFGLDYHRLVEGGREIADGKGDVGEALLAAAGDLGSAVEHMRAFQGRAGDLFQPHARSQSKLSVALRNHREAERRIRSEKFSSQSYRTAVRELDDLRRESSRLADELRACAGENRRLTRLRQAVAGVALLAQKQRELDNMASSTVLSPDFKVRHGDLVKLLERCVAKIENSHADLDRLTKTLDAIKRDPKLAELRIEIEQLFSASGKIEAGRQDRPKREGELSQLRDGVSRNLRLLSLDLDPANCVCLRVKLLQRNEITQLAQKYTTLITRMEEAKNRIASLRAEEDGNRLALAELPPDQDTSDLATQLIALTGVPVDADLAEMRERLASAQSTCNAEIKALPLFSGTGEQLEQLTVPLTATVRAWQGRYAEQESAERQLTTDEETAIAETANLERDVQQLEHAGDVPAEGDLDRSRSRRDLGWTAVKHRWLQAEAAPVEVDFMREASSGQPLDAAYEHAVLNADTLADRLRLDASQVEKKALLLEQIARSNERLAKTRQKTENAAVRRRELDVQWYSIWAACGIEPLSPTEMLDWLERRRDTVEKFRVAVSLKRQVDDLQDLVSGLHSALKHALEGFTDDTDRPLAELVEHARRVVNHAEANRTRTRDLDLEQKRLKSELAQAELRWIELEQTMAAWSGDWACAIKGLPVPPEAKPDVVLEVVRLLDTIATDSEQINALAHRIHTMKKDDQEFSAAVIAMAARSGVSAESPDSLINIKRLNSAASSAAQNEDAAANVMRDIDHTNDRLCAAQQEAEQQRLALAALCAEAGVQHADELPAAIADSELKRILSSQVEEQRLALLPACAGRSLDELVQAVLALDMDALPAQVAELESRQQLLEQQRQECERRTVELEREFQLHESSSSLSDAVAEKQSMGARIAYLAEEYLEQALSARLISAAIERYRTRHQDPLLERAGQLLRELTCGSFTGLAVDFDEENRRVLKAVRGFTGTHVDVSGMSDGARDQLFFALRLAYIEDHAAGARTCPVILDDVLMAFDDERATAALRVLGEISRKTQILLFTHHAHHLQLARNALTEATLTIHELAQSKAAAL